MDGERRGGDVEALLQRRRGIHIDINFITHTHTHIQTYRHIIRGTLINMKLGGRRPLLALFYQSAHTHTHTHTHTHKHTQQDAHLQASVARPTQPLNACEVAAHVQGSRGPWATAIPVLVCVLCVCVCV